MRILILILILAAGCGDEIAPKGDPPKTRCDVVRYQYCADGHHRVSCQDGLGRDLDTPTIEYCDTCYTDGPLTVCLQPDGTET